MYKLVVLDLDGTTLNNRGRLTKRTKGVIKQLQDRGIMVTICTGRNLKTTYPLVKELKLNIPFLCIDGTMMYATNKEVLYKNNLSYEEVKRIIDIAQKEDIYVEVVSNIYYKYIKNKNLKKYDFHMSNHWLDRIVRYYTGRKYIQDLNVLLHNLESTQTETHQVLLAGEKDFVRKAKEKIQKNLGDKIEMRDQLWGDYLFINKPGVRKSVGVGVLCEYLGITMDEVVAIGDQKNDIDMLELAGLGIAMGNAADEVKKVADDITLSNEEDGVAYALEHYFLGEKHTERTLITGLGLNQQTL